jgi:hypothetical protein
MQKNKIFSKLIEQTKENSFHFLNTFSEQIINNEASLFLGTGVSRNSGYPSWMELLTPCANELGIEITAESDLFAVAQYYANKHGDVELRRIVSGAVNKIAQSNAIVEELLDVGFSSIWTTNYDTLIERGLTKRFISHNAISNDLNLASINKQEKVNIYKMNGDISAPSNMILTKNDHEHYEKEHPLFLTFLRKELVSNTFLFVGYSFSDTMVLNCINAINEFLGEYGNCHYAIMLIDENVNSQFEYFIDDLNQRYNIKCLCVDKREILSIIRSLNHKIRERKVFISGAYDTITKELNEQADKLSAELIGKLYENNYRISTGIGRNLGTFITVYAHRYLAEHNIPNPSNHLSMRPFPFHLKLDNDTKVKYRKSMQNDCSAAIFLFGQSKGTEQEGSFAQIGHYSRGVYQEFEIAKELGLVIIPIGSTGLESEVIWSEVKNNINKYPYLSKKIDLLLNEKDPCKISELIISILQDIPKYQSIQQ